MAGKVIVAVLPVAGSKVYAAEPTTLVKFVPSVLPRTVSVWVRVAQAVAGGSLSTIRPTLTADPRSTVIDCGKALLADSQ